MWETWFVISIVIVFAYLCVGVMTGSAEQFLIGISLLYFAIVNLLVSL
jgi:hypothetical protein